MKKIAFLAMVLTLCLTLPAMGKDDKKKPKVDPAIYKLPNLLKKAKKGDYAYYNVVLKSPMSPEPMKSTLSMTVISANPKKVTVRFKTNLMGQNRVETQILPRTTPIVQAILIILQRQFRLKVKIHKAKLKTVKVKYEGKTVNAKMVDAEVSGIGASGQKGKNQMKLWIYNDIAVFGFMKAAIQTYWKLGDTQLKLEFTMILAKHSAQKASVPPKETTPKGTE